MLSKQMHLLTLRGANNLPRQKLVIVYGMALVLATMASYRVFGFDRDYYNYLAFFENPMDSRLEPAFQLLTLQFASALPNFTAYLFVLAFISLLIKSYLITKLTKHPLFGMLVYFLMLYPLHEMTQIRAALSLGFFYYAIYLVAFSRPFLAAVIFLLATSFHTSTGVLGLLAALLWLFAPTNSSPGRLISVALVIAFVISFYGYSLSEQLGVGYTYFDSSEYANPFSIQALSFSFITALGLRRFKSIPPPVRVWLYISIIGIVLYFSLLQFQVLSHRFFQATLFSYIVWITSLPRRERTISMAIVMLNAITAFYLMIFNNPFFE